MAVEGLTNVTEDNLFVFFFLIFLILWCRSVILDAHIVTLFPLVPFSAICALLFYCFVFSLFWFTIIIIAVYKFVP